MKPVKQLIKKAIHRVTRPRFRLCDTIALTGTPRSGTTWIAEELQRRLTLDVINEPLHLTRSPQGKEHGFEWMTCIEPHEDRSAEARYLSDVAKGLTSAGWFAPCPENKRRQVFGFPRRKLLVKFVRANRFLGWMARQLDFAVIVCVVRHPCAVIASKIAMGKREGSAWGQFKPPAADNIQTGFDGKLPDHLVDQFGDVLRSAKTSAGALACMWALDNYLASRDWVHDRCMLVSYENLTLNSISPLMDALEQRGFAKPNSASGTPNQENPTDTSAMPSKVASPDFDAADPQKQLSKWKDQLSADEIDEILGISHGFGLTFVSEDPIPDLAKLREQFQGAPLIA